MSVRVVFLNKELLTICDNEIRQAGLINGIDGIATQNTVGNNGEDLLRAMLVNRLCCLGELSWISISQRVYPKPAYRSTSVGHVIDEDSHFVLDITNEDHAANDIGSRSLLVDESKRRIKAIGNRRCTLGTTSVGGDDDAILDIQILPNPAED